MSKKVKIVIVICILVILAVIGREIYLQFNVSIGVRSIDYVVLTMDDAISISDLIVLAEATTDTKVKSKIEKQENGKLIKTSYEETTFKINEVYLGDKTIQDIVCRDDNGSEKIEFKKGEQAILFLRYDSRNNAYYFVGGEQGKCVYDSEQGKYVSRTLEFEDIQKEIERYESTPEEERQIM